jgi:hypothetical protein
LAHVFEQAPLPLAVQLKVTNHIFMGVFLLNNLEQFLRIERL